MTHTTDSETGALKMRPAHPEDIPAIARIERIPEYRAFIGRYTEEQHAVLLASPDSAYWVLESPDDKILGFCLLCGLLSPHKSIELRRIALAHAGGGLGKLFFAFLLQKIFSLYGAHRVWLDVFEGNPRARHLYRSFGFREDGLLRESVLRDGHYYTHLLMSMLDREYRPVDCISRANPSF